MSSVHRIKNVFIEQGLWGLVYKVLNKLFNKLYSIKWSRSIRDFDRALREWKWKKAIEVGEDLLKSGFSSIEFHRKMAICYKCVKNYELAKDNMKIALEMKFNLQLDNIIDTIENSIASDTDSIESKYLYIDGWSNLGFIEHIQRNQLGSGNYITKIIANKDLADKEKLFYLEICELYPALKYITPKVINILELQSKHICFMTFEKIIGRKPDEKNLNDVIRTNKIIGSVRYSDRDIGNLVPVFEPKRAIKLSNNIYHHNNFTTNFMHAFASVHKESTNKAIFRWLNTRMKKLNCSSQTIALMKRLKYIILNLKMYERVDPAVNYTFLHNDFNGSNIIIEDISNRCYVIDWATYGRGPMGFDLVQIFLNRGLTFEEICKRYLNIDDKEQMDSIEKIFFVYPLIISWFTYSDGKEIESRSKHFIGPAVEYIESLVLRINK